MNDPPKIVHRSTLAEQTGSVLAECGDLYVENDVVYYRSNEGPLRVGAIYRRVGDEYLDPTTFLPESLIGIPGVMNAYRAGNVALLNAPGNGVADDKGIYYFVVERPAKNSASFNSPFGHKNTAML